MTREFIKALSHNAKKVFERQWKFESLLVTSIDRNGNANCTTGGREFQKTRIGGVGQTELGSGDRQLTLGSTVHDMPVGLGKFPWITG